MKRGEEISARGRVVLILSIRGRVRQHIRSGPQKRKTTGLTPDYKSKKLGA